MIVDHARRLHEGVDDGRAAELEACVLQRLRHFLRGLGFRLDIVEVLQPVLNRLSIDEFPEEIREAFLLLDIKIGARGKDRALDLLAIADDAFVGHQLLEFRRRIARDLRRLEAIEGLTKIVALAQDGDPRQARLKSIEQQLLEQGARIIFRHAPFVVVIGDIERIDARPAAAGKAVVMHHSGARLGFLGHALCIAKCGESRKWTADEPRALRLAFAD